MQSTLFEEEELRDAAHMEVIQFLEEGVLPHNECYTHKLGLQEQHFTTIDHTIYHMDS